MSLTGVLTRAQFNQACKCFIREQTLHSADELLSRSHSGWQWQEHSTLVALGYMARVGSATQKSLECVSSRVPDTEIFEELVEDDISTLPQDTPTHELLIVHQYVVYSPTFQVPAFYFTVHNGDGSAVDLQDIVKSSLFHAHALPGNAVTEPHSFTLPASNFPLLSQGDHPVLGTPCWYFHPCETSAAVTEILREAGPQEDQTVDEKLLGWLKAWFLVLCSVVDLR